MGGSFALRCRTCDRAPARVDLAGERLVAVCAECTDRTPLRCPICRMALVATGPDTALCCERPWIARRDQLFDATGPVPEAPPPPIAAPVVEPPRAKRRPRKAASQGRLATHVVTSTKAAGYRDALFSQVLELERRAFSKAPPTREATPFSRSPLRIALAAAAALAVLIAAFAGGSAGVIAVLCAIAPVALLAYGAWFLLYGVPEPMIRVPAQALRITPERVETAASNVWQTVAKPGDLARVHREPTDEGVRIRVELDSGRSLTVLDHLSEEEAILAEEQIEAQLARVRG